MKYVVHKDGNVFNFKNGQYQTMSPGVSKRGYRMIKIYSSDGSRQSRPIHRLVATGYIPNTHAKPCINHKNGIKIDNRVKNLEWCTQEENVNHSYASGLQQHGNRGGGICWDAYHGRWIAFIKHDGRQYRKTSARNRSELAKWLVEMSARLEK